MVYFWNFPLWELQSTVGNLTMYKRIVYSFISIKTEMTGACTVVINMPGISFLEPEATPLGGKMPLPSCHSMWLRCEVDLPLAFWGCATPPGFRDEPIPTHLTPANEGQPVLLAGSPGEKAVFSLRWLNCKQVNQNCLWSSLTSCREGWGSRQREAGPCIGEKSGPADLA